MAPCARHSAPQSKPVIIIGFKSYASRLTCATEQKKWIDSSVKDFVFGLGFDSTDALHLPPLCIHPVSPLSSFITPSATKPHFNHFKTIHTGIPPSSFMRSLVVSLSERRPRVDGRLYYDVPRAGLGTFALPLRTPGVAVRLAGPVRSRGRSEAGSVDGGPRRNPEIDRPGDCQHPSSRTRRLPSHSRARGTLLSARPGLFGNHHTLLVIWIEITAATPLQAGTLSLGDFSADSRSVYALTSAPS